MLRSRLFSGVGIGTLLIAGTFFMQSCSNKITEEQLKQLQELRKQEKSHTEMIDKKRAEKSKLESELNTRKSELNRCNEENDFIKKKLAAWPDIWPDWKPVQETPAEIK